jgi:hypothetical protein
MAEWARRVESSKALMLSTILVMYDDDEKFC